MEATDQDKTRYFYPSFWTKRLAQRQPIARLRLGFGSVETEISIFLDKTLVVGEKFHRVVWLESIGFDGGIYLRLEQPHQFNFVPLGHGKHLADGAAFDDFLNIPAGLFVGIEENMHLRDAAKQVVQVAHDILISAHHENADVIHFPGRDAMER